MMLVAWKNVHLNLERLRLLVFLATITAEQILGSSGRIHKDTRIRLVLLRLLPDLPTLDDQTSEPVIKLF